jgi:hypothetical protein
MGVPSQINVRGGVASEPVGVGLTVMLKVLENPVQVIPEIVLLGVMVMVATMGAPVELVAINDGILPVPDAGSPIEGVLFVQLKMVPTTKPDSKTGLEGNPLQTA